MKLKSTLTLAICVGAVTAVLAGPQQPVFRGGVDSIELNVAVFQRNKPIAGLALQDFEVIDNGVTQQVLSVSRETLPFDLSLVIDTSGSIDTPMAEAIRSAIGEIRGRLRVVDRLSLMTFNQPIRERVALAPPNEVRALNVGQGAGWTALNDAIGVALSVPPPVDRRQMAIVFTDWYDTISLLDEASVLDIAGRARTTVSIVAKAADTTSIPKPFFDKLADLTGGVVQMVQPYEQIDIMPGRVSIRSNVHLLDSAFINVLEDFRTSYVVRYSLSGVPRAGWHDVSVRIVKPKTNYQVRTRRGYVGG